MVLKYNPDLYMTQTETPSSFVIEATAAMQKWVDSGFSMELHLPGGSSWAGNKVFSDDKFLAYELGVKAIYYIRTSEPSTSGCTSCSN